MKPDRNSNTEFWLELLEPGNDQDQARRNWNVFCHWKFGAGLGGVVSGQQSGKIWDELGAVEYIANHTEYQARVIEIRERFDGYPILEDGPITGEFPDEPLMDFTGKELPRDVSFAGRLVVNSSFNNTAFRKQSSFENTIFVNYADFTGTRFGDNSGNQASSVSFTGSRFHGSAHFNYAQFPRTTWLDQVTFNDLAVFEEAEFGRQCSGSDEQNGWAFFSRSQFKHDADFPGSRFNVTAEFDHAVFDGKAIFDGARFRKPVTFNNAKFQNRTSFRKATFGRPPRFFETEIHEDVSFDRIDWRSAERSYSRRNRRNDKPDSIVKDSEDAIRAWDRLVLIMGEQEKLTERHEFYRLMMRAQRQRDGYRSLSSIANWLFDKSSDFGWGIRRAFLWWFGHIAFGAVILADGWPAVLNSLLVSFANSLAFLRLGSEGGYLDGSHKALEGASSHPDWVFSTVGTTQAVLGPVLLFLVLLTLRNRFRLG